MIVPVAKRKCLFRKVILGFRIAHLKTAMGWKPHSGFESHALRSPAWVGGP